MQSCMFRNKEWEPNLHTEDCVLNGGVSEKGWGVTVTSNTIGTPSVMLWKKQAIVFKLGSIKWDLR